MPTSSFDFDEQLLQQDSQQDYGRLGPNGARRCCAVASAPQGSFTNHFRSKEAFAKEVLDRYFANLQERIGGALNEKSLTPRQRLERYLEIISGLLAGDKWKRGCLIGDFSLETSAQSKLMRARLEAILHEWREPFALCIAEAQAIGEIDSTFDPCRRKCL
ncbi:MAG: TetR family transcriptional regulator C-terminal domain-containing protein [Terracidiphilus sp.]